MFLPHGSGSFLITISLADLPSSSIYLSLVLHEVDKSKYKLQTENGSLIKVQIESTFELGFSSSKRITITCLISDSLITLDIIIFWREMIAL